MSASKPRIKKLLIAVFVLVLAGVGTIWYLFTEKFGDTVNEKPAYKFSATDLIKEFKKNDTVANKLYAEKIIVVTGIVTTVEAAGTSINIKMTDTTGSYVIFAFQQQHLAEARAIKEGDNVSIKGSCSGGAYSEILETEFITFKRCALNKE